MRFSIFDTEFHIYLIVPIIKQIVVHYPTGLEPLHGKSYYRQYEHWPIDLSDYMYIFDVKVYDGPGILSPLVAPVCNTTTENCTCYLSSYQGLVKYRMPIPSNFKTGDGWNYFENQMPDNHSEEVGIIWTSNMVFNSSTNCLHQGQNTHFESKSGICWSRSFPNLVTVHTMVFKGYDMHIDSREPCLYGGLFILLYDPQTQMFLAPSMSNPNLEMICWSINSEIVLPVRTRPPFSTQIVIVFTSFKGYSSGYVDLTISQDTDCSGSNYVKPFHFKCGGPFWHGIGIHTGKIRGK